MNCKVQDFQQIVKSIEKDRDNKIKDRHGQKGIVIEKDTLANTLQEMRQERIEMIIQGQIWIERQRFEMDRLGNIVQERQKSIEIIIKGQLWIER